jgi:hypothetical protein
VPTGRRQEAILPKSTISVVVAREGSALVSNDPGSKKSIRQRWRYVRKGILDIPGGPADFPVERSTLPLQAPPIRSFIRPGEIDFTNARTFHRLF